MTKEEVESGISSRDVERTSSIKKQKRDIFGIMFCVCECVYVNMCLCCGRGCICVGEGGGEA